MSSASSVLSARRRWSISLLPRKMNRSSVLIAMTTSLLLGVMAVPNHSGEVIKAVLYLNVLHSICKADMRCVK